VSSAAHLAMGKALSSLRDENIMIMGSGSSYHNMGGFFGQVRGANEHSAQFDRWLTAVLGSGDTEKRHAALVGWEHAPHARACHPARGEEHLLPCVDSQ
jgi:aromatic ring-opening dioxygenase catalytic subunit (LigB family)